MSVVLADPGVPHTNYRRRRRDRQKSQLAEQEAITKELKDKFDSPGNANGVSPASSHDHDVSSTPAGRVPATELHSSSNSRTTVNGDYTHGFPSSSSSSLRSSRRSYDSNINGGHSVLTQPQPYIALHDAVSAPLTATNQYKRTNGHLNSSSSEHFLHHQHSSHPSNYTSNNSGMPTVAQSSSSQQPPLQSPSSPQPHGGAANYTVASSQSGSFSDRLSRLRSRRDIIMNKQHSTDSVLNNGVAAESASRGGGGSSGARVRSENLECISKFNQHGRRVSAESGSGSGGSAGGTSHSSSSTGGRHVSVGAESNSCDVTSDNKYGMRTYYPAKVHSDTSQGATSSISSQSAPLMSPRSSASSHDTFQSARDNSNSIVTANSQSVELNGDVDSHSSSREEFVDVTSHLDLLSAAASAASTTGSSCGEYVDVSASSVHDAGSSGTIDDAADDDAVDDDEALTEGESLLVTVSLVCVFRLFCSIDTNPRDTYNVQSYSIIQQSPINGHRVLVAAMLMMEFDCISRCNL